MRSPRCINVLKRSPLSLVDHCVHHLLLAHDPARIAAPVVTEAHVRHGLVAVEMLHALFEMNVEVAPAVVVIERFAGAVRSCTAGSSSS